MSFCVDGERGHEIAPARSTITGGRRRRAAWPRKKGQRFWTRCRGRHGRVVNPPRWLAKERRIGAPQCSRSVDRQLQMRQREPARRLRRRSLHGRRGGCGHSRDGRNREGRNALGRRRGDTGGVAAVHSVCAAAGAVHQALCSRRPRYRGGSRHAGRGRGCVSRRRHGGRRRCRAADQRVHAEKTRDQQSREDDYLQPVPAAAGSIGRGLHTQSIPPEAYPLDETGPFNGESGPPCGNTLKGYTVALTQVPTGGTQIEEAIR